jgi:hypothetical protein
MRHTIRLFLLLEGATFVTAGLVHFGVLTHLDRDPQAARAESTIAAVLLLGFGLSWVWPSRTRGIGLAAQAFALTFTLVGAYLSVVGIGPHTVPDVVFHVGILLALVWGLVVAARGASRQPEATRLAWVTVVNTLARATGLLQLALGLAFWTGTLLIAVPFHTFNGQLFALLLEAQAGLAARAGVSWRLVVLAVAWGLFVVAFGMTQSQVLPGDWHWLVRVAHLLVGLAAMGVAERLAVDARARLQGGGTGGPGQAAPELASGRWA